MLNLHFLRWLLFLNLSLSSFICGLLILSLFEVISRADGYLIPPINILLGVLQFEGALGGIPWFFSYNGFSIYYNITGTLLKVVYNCYVYLDGESIKTEVLVVLITLWSLWSVFMPCTLLTFLKKPGLNRLLQPGTKVGVFYADTTRICVFDGSFLLKGVVISALQNDVSLRLCLFEAGCSGDTLSVDSVDELFPPELTFSLLL